MKSLGDHNSVLLHHNPTAQPQPFHVNVPNDNLIKIGSHFPPFLPIIICHLDAGVLTSTFRTMHYNYMVAIFIIISISTHCVYGLVRAWMEDWDWATTDTVTVVTWGVELGNFILFRPLCDLMKIWKFSMEKFSSAFLALNTKGLLMEKHSPSEFLLKLFHTLASSFWIFWKYSSEKFIYIASLL